MEREGDGDWERGDTKGGRNGREWKKVPGNKVGKEKGPPAA